MKTNDFEKIVRYKKLFSSKENADIKKKKKKHTNKHTNNNNKNASVIVSVLRVDIVPPVSICIIFFYGFSPTPKRTLLSTNPLTQIITTLTFLTQLYRT